MHSFFFSSSSSSSSDSDDSNIEPKKGKCRLNPVKRKNKELYEICQLSLKYGMFAESILTDPSICAFHKHSYVRRMRGGDFSYEFINRYSSGLLPKLIHLRHLNWEDREKSKKLSKIFLKAVIILFNA